ncbi:MAG: ATP-binding protein [Archangium sp.]|nr:ATP-binding protein [Archangium sp.]MDP3569706.1 ATP-binding protein [Archangium sp.]
MDSATNETSERERLRSLVAGSFDAFYIVTAIRDKQQVIVDFRFADMNQRAEERLHKPRAEVIGKTMLTLFPRGEMAPFIARFAAVVESRQPTEEETSVAVTGIDVTWIRYHMAPLGETLAVTSRDISQQKKEAAALLASQEALKRSHDELELRVAERTAELQASNAELTAQIAKRRLAEDRFTRLFESGLMAISIADTKGKVFEVNEGFSKIVGYSREELLDPAFDGLKLTPPEYAEVTARNRALLMSHGVVPPHEREFFRKDGSRVSVLMGVALLGKTEVLVCATDLSEFRRTQAALGHAQDQLRQSQKMEAIGSLAGGVAHDFNNLLSVILSYGGMIESSLTEGDPMREDVVEIVAAGRRAADLTRQLLAFSRKQILKPRIVALNTLISGLERLLRRLIGENIEFTVLPQHDLGMVEVDPSQLEQVVMNLAVNARDAMPDGGKLTIETSNVHLSEDYAREHPEVTPGLHVMVAVSDNGCGMDAATRARVFDPFFTTKGPGKGTGLGLSTVFGIVKQSGGHIWVYSEPGAGTTFKVYFPCANAAAHEPEVSAPAFVAPSRGAETVLLVEDEERVRTLARTVLKRHGYHVLEAQSGGDALLICEQHPARIDLLLTDVVMPRMTGRQLADRLRSVRPEMKVLYMSGYTDNSIVHHGVLDSGINFLEKPLTVETLTSKVREVLDGRVLK